MRQSLPFILMLMSALYGCDDEPTQGSPSAGAEPAGVEMGGVTPTGGEVGGVTPTGGEVGGAAPSGGAMGGVTPAGEEAGEVPPAPEVTLTVRALNPLSGQGLSGLSATLVSGADEELRSITDMSGAASFSLPAGARYEVALDAEGYATHRLFGVLGDADATQLSFVSEDGLTSQVFSALGLSPDPAKGIVVIGLDRPNLAPAVGASAELSAEYDVAFTLGNFGPSRGNEVVAGGGGFVSFANVTPGDVEVLVQPSEGERCDVFPRNESAEFILPVSAGEVSVVAFTCQGQ